MDPTGSRRWPPEKACAGGAVPPGWEKVLKDISWPAEGQHVEKWLLQLYGCLLFVEPEHVRVVIVGAPAIAASPAWLLDAVVCDVFRTPGGGPAASSAAALGRLAGVGVEAARTRLAAPATATYDFTHWCAQGVLVVDDGAGCSAAAQPRRNELVNSLLGVLKPRKDISWLLWGEHNVRSDGIAGRVERGEGDLAGVSHFSAANVHALAYDARRVTWVEAPTVAACDGGCAANGKPKARGGWGMLFTTGPLKGLKASGPVCPYVYQWVDEADPASGFRPDATRAATPSNNRAEYLGVCFLLLAAVRAKLRGPIDIVADSQLVISTLETWLPCRRGKGTAAALKNFDLVCIAEKLLALARRCGTVRFTHQKSHIKLDKARAAWARDPPTAPLMAHRWQANASADALAAVGAEQTSGPHCTPPFWLPG